MKPHRHTMTRRDLLRAGVFGSLAVWAGGRVTRAARRAVAATDGEQRPRAVLTPSGEEILRAVIPVVLGSLLPAQGDARDKALDVGLATLDDYLAHLPVPLQEQACDVFATLDLLPTRLLLMGTWDRWHEASPETIEAFLRFTRQSRFLLLRRMFAFLHSMAVLSWFDQRAAWPGIGYGGPPIDRPLASEAAT